MLPRVLQWLKNHMKEAAIHIIQIAYAMDKLFV